MCYFKKGDYDQATTEVKILLEKYPRSELSPDAMYLFANCKYLLGRCDEAITGYKKLIERYPISKYIVDAKYGIGMCLEEEEKLQEAHANPIFCIYNIFDNRIPFNKLLITCYCLITSSKEILAICKVIQDRKSV